jgi:putative ABC transport system permease protein
MEGVYKDFTGGITIDYEFFDQTIASWYDKEKRMSIIIKYFAILSIIISVMGIYAMSVFYNQQKIKEIGVRKVNGATVFEIIKMLNKDFVKWVLIAFVIAVPIAYYAMNKWLETFAYRIDLSWWIFVLAGILALIIALATVSWNTFISARRNPVKSLMHE